MSLTPGLINQVHNNQPNVLRKKLKQGICNRKMKKKNVIKKQKYPQMCLKVLLNKVNEHKEIVPWEHYSKWLFSTRPQTNLG